MKEAPIQGLIDWTTLPPGSLVMGPIDRGHKQAKLPDGTLIQTPESWGAESIEDAEEIRSAIRRGVIPGSEGARTLAGAAGGWLKRNMPEFQTYSVPTRFREIFSFIRVGPMVSVVGSFDNVYHLDRRKAYLHGFYLPMPVGRSYNAIAPKRAKAMLDNGIFTGVVHARISVPNTIGDVGPLPALANLVKTNAKYTELTTETPDIVWPVGAPVEGVWTDNLVYAALECGCVIEEVYAAVTYQTEIWLDGVGDIILAGAESTDPIEARAWKSVYQTGWLKLKGEARWLEEIVTETTREVRRERYTDDGKREVWRESIPTTKLVRRPMKPSRILQNKIDPSQAIFRPDISQRISAYNVESVTRMARKYGCLAAHIDSLHTPRKPDKRDLSEDIGGWRIVESGPAVFNGPGQKEYNPASAYALDGKGNLWRSTERELARLDYLDKPKWSLFDPAWSPSGWYEPWRSPIGKLEE